MAYKKNRKTKKLVPLSKKIIRMIAIILTCIMVTIVFITEKSLDTLYLAQSAVQSFFAFYEIENAYTDPELDFFTEMDSIERNNVISVEIYSAHGDFVYSSSYKGEQSRPPYNQYSKILPESIKKNYEVVQNLGEVSSNTFNISRDTASSRNTEYLVGSWKTEAGLTIKIFSAKTVVDSNAKLAVAFVALVAVIVSVIGYFVISVVIRRTMRPLADMSEVTRNMSALDFSEKCETGTTTEIALLADSINEMSVSLESALNDLRQKNEKLTDDIEKEKTIDRLRQTFISGVSHELKTPIAIIQGYSEGLKVFLESDPETARKYCDTIINETERMNYLVMKLLDIIKYESGEYKLNYETFSIYGIIEDWFVRNNTILSEKGITAVNNIDKEIKGFGDLFILTTVVNNYISNAVAHVQNEMRIEASAEEIDADRYRISIFNTGAPIDAKDIDHIWTSFYRADKAMSRAEGRYGLGLATVASIQKLHEQEYGVINREDGVEFWFDVKKNT